MLCVELCFLTCIILGRLCVCYCSTALREGDQGLTWVMPGLLHKCPRVHFCILFVYFPRYSGLMDLRVKYPPLRRTVPKCQLCPRQPLSGPSVWFILTLSSNADTPCPHLLGSYLDSHLCTEESGYRCPLGTKGISSKAAEASLPRACHWKSSQGVHSKPLSLEEGKSKPQRGQA